MSGQERALVARGQLEVMRSQIVEFLPEIKGAPTGTQLALAYLAVNYGLDPFLNELWAIPRKSKGVVIGWSVMLGIAGLRKVAFRCGEYAGRTFRWLDEQEAKFLGVELQKGDHGIACLVWRRGIKEPFVGYGVVKADELSRMNHGKLAQLRAERDGLKGAFSSEIAGLLGGIKAEPVVVAEDVEEEEEVEGKGRAVEAVGTDVGKEGVSASVGVEDLFGPQEAVGEAESAREALPGEELVAGGGKQHWIDNPKQRRAFWAWAWDHGLGSQDVYRLLGVAHIHEYGGGPTECMAAIVVGIQDEMKSKEGKAVA